MHLTVHIAALGDVAAIFAGDLLPLTESTSVVLADKASFVVTLISFICSRNGSKMPSISSVLSTGSNEP